MTERARSTRKPTSVPTAEWETWPDERLLATRVRDLGLQIEESPLKASVQTLYDELAAHNIVFRPPCYFADEWFCPDKQPIIGIPFYLAHPRLKQIEQKMMFEVEGGTPESCLMLLRHECGHALNYAYRLYRRTRWRELFGPFSAPYSTSYRFQPYSKRFVTHLPESYAQAHPDEDFAETFAVWLTPGSRWQERYDGWPALKKLLYVDRAMAELAGVMPTVSTHDTPWSAARMTSTLASFYERRRKELGVEFAGYYDGVLREIFGPCPPGAERPVRAAVLMRQQARHIMDSVALWTGLRKFDVHQFIAKLTRRCTEMDLYVTGSEQEALIQISSLVTAIMGRSFCVEGREERGR